MKKLTALTVLLAFLFTLQISIQPLGAETTMLAQDETPTIMIEEEGDDAYTARKKSLLPIILGGLAVGAVVAVLFLVVLKSYDIRGTWTALANIENTGWGNPFTMAFTGNKKSGTFMESNLFPGTYTVDGKKVTMTYDSWPITLTGEFTDKDTIEGTIAYGTAAGVFKMNRTASTVTGFASAPLGGKGEIK